VWDWDCDVGAAAAAGGRCGGIVGRGGSRAVCVVVRAGGREGACLVGGGGSGPWTRIDVLESGWGAVGAGEMITAAASVVVVGREV
jgi:hypothetical protein